MLDQNGRMCMKSTKAEWVVLANRTQNEWRAVGGNLTATNGKLIFKPNIIDRNLGGDFLELRLDEIASIGKCKKEIAIKHLFSGGLRDRLSIQLRNGKEELFVVNNLETVIAELSRMISS